GQRNRLVVVEGLYSIRGDVAPLADIGAACREHGAYLLVDEAHSLGTYGPTGLGCAEAQGVLDQVDFIVGTFSKSLAGIGGVCVSDHRELRALHFLARAYVFTASGSPSNIESVRAALGVVRRHPELREQLWTNIRHLRDGLRDLGYTIGDTESPIVPILIGEEPRTIALWQRLLSEVDVRHDAKSIAQPVDAADESFGRQLGVPAPVDRDRPAAHHSGELTAERRQEQGRRRHRHNACTRSHGRSDPFEQLAADDR